MRISDWSSDVCSSDLLVGPLHPGRGGRSLMTEGTIGCEAARTDLSRRNLLIGIALAGASGIAFTRQPAVANPVVPKKLFEAWVPRRLDRKSTRLNSSH